MPVYASHLPTHIHLDGTAYFITAAIYQKRKLLAQPQVKEKLLEFINLYFAKFSWQLQHWVILDDHYHLLGQSYRGQDLNQIMRHIHSHSAQHISQITQATKPIWWNYWDYCPRHQADYYTHLNYLLYNPIKHGYTDNLQNYPFSSFHTLYEEIGHVELKRQFQLYKKYRTLALLGFDDM